MSAVTLVRGQDPDPPQRSGRHHGIVCAEHGASDPPSTPTATAPQCWSSDAQSSRIWPLCFNPFFPALGNQRIINRYHSCGVRPATSVTSSATRSSDRIFGWKYVADKRATALSLM